MIARASFAERRHPHVRPIDPWRDGRALADLLESAFADETLDESSSRMLHRLRYYGSFDLITFGLGTGFVWVEGGELLGSASIQRNPTRRDTWIIGNVATRADHRNRGIGRTLVETCIEYAAARKARYVALQADITNAPALHLYEKLGFEHLIQVTHYLRAPVRAQRVVYEDDGLVRSARWSDRATVLALAQANISPLATFAESFDSNVYRLGFRWWLFNSLSGNPEAWHVAEDGSGAVRTRVNYEGSYHHLELLLDADSDEETALALVAQGLKRFELFLSKPIYAAHARPHERVHSALQAQGFRPLRTLTHMRLTLQT
ncbi:MAG: GNAT family N-acetyltransferase [Anaerolineae bacterium]|nr:GNAT family N-acetyltransferase [Thermoflexales bacterium]MDW8396520.1 GNAT family N-acetyltransferase [Anaerolineae bacterium]